MCSFPCVAVTDLKLTRTSGKAALGGFGRPSLWGCGCTGEPRCSTGLPYLPPSPPCAPRMSCQGLPIASLSGAIGRGRAAMCSASHQLPPFPPLPASARSRRSGVTQGHCALFTDSRQMHGALGPWHCHPGEWQGRHASAGLPLGAAAMLCKRTALRAKCCASSCNPSLGSNLKTRRAALV